MDDAAPGFAYCQIQVVKDFYSGFPDPVRATTPYVAGLLERGIRVLIFAGEHASLCVRERCSQVQLRCSRLDMVRGD